MRLSQCIFLIPYTKPTLIIKYPIVLYTIPGFKNMYYLTRNKLLVSLAVRSKDPTAPYCVVRSCDLTIWNSLLPIFVLIDHAIHWIPTFVHRSTKPFGEVDTATADKAGASGYFPYITTR